MSIGKTQIIFLLIKFSIMFNYNFIIYTKIFTILFVKFLFQYQLVNNRLCKKENITRYKLMKRE